MTTQDSQMRAIAQQIDDAVKKKAYGWLSTINATLLRKR